LYRGQHKTATLADRERSAVAETMSAAAPKKREKLGPQPRRVDSTLAEICQFFLIVNATSGVGDVQMRRSVTHKRSWSVWDAIFRSIGIRLRHMVETARFGAAAYLMIA
jgi:hypothetical protein